MIKICEGVFLIPEDNRTAVPDCNVYVIGDIDEFFLVDSGNGVFSEDKLEELEKAGFKLDNCKYIVLTHLHFDHTGGIKDFKKKVVLHENGVKNLENPRSIFGSDRLMEMSKQAGLSFEKFEILKTVKDGDEVEGWRVIHTPGHSSECICLYHKTLKILVSGDTIFANSIGRTDLFSSSNEDMKISLKKIQELDVEFILPGHGNHEENSERIKEIVKYFLPIL
ncbi:MBL fold metallo-hydrolase [Nanoarchaeota archaeon]